jgi:transcription termination/antitermination protein NusA
MQEFAPCDETMGNPLRAAITALMAERGLPRELVIDTMSRALLDVYRRSTHSSGDNVHVIVDAGGEVHMLVNRRVVAQVTDPQAEVSLAEAQRIKAHAALGETIQVEAPELLDRIPVRSAGQVILQRLREAEQNHLLDQFKDRVDEIMAGTIQRPNGDDGFIIQLDKIEGVLGRKDMAPGERYRIQQRLRVYIVEIKRLGGRPPQAIVSRTHPNLVKRLFEQEVPEIMDGSVELKALVREPGSRSKVAVWARKEGIDPIGACVGVRGTRINNIVNELNGEKIDIVPWDPDPATFVLNALSPAKPLRVELRQADHTALVTVPERQLSLAIGKDGQNARLAARLTGWRIDVSKPGGGHRHNGHDAPSESSASL